jgi:hypothetical protein
MKNVKRNVRKYSLFWKKPGEKKWTRVGSFSYPLKTASAAWQHTMLQAIMLGMEVKLRPVDRDNLGSLGEVDQDAFLDTLHGKDYFAEIRHPEGRKGGVA